MHSGVDSALCPHSQEIDQILARLGSSHLGISPEEAAARLKKAGSNALPEATAPTLAWIFLRQFLNPLIYVLLAAAAVSAFLHDLTDAFFIALVLLVNAIIGTIQEYGAEKSAQALRAMAAAKASVERNGQVFEVDAQSLVVGDLVWLESGRKVPADLRLMSTHSLEVDESMLTGESIPVAKSHEILCVAETTLDDRKNMAFSGTLVTKGRAKGVVTATALETELGKIAGSLLSGVSATPPLLIRMKAFTRRLAIFLLAITLALALTMLSQGHYWHDVMMFGVAMAVSAIPEGLPVALTVALGIASRRMAKRNVIVRKLPAVEALGSCTYIATDKTGTLTVNQLTVQKVTVPGLPTFSVTGSGLDLGGSVLPPELADSARQIALVKRLVTHSILCNEARWSDGDDGGSITGDAVDVAFLMLGCKLGIKARSVRGAFRLLDEIPFEPQTQYVATLHQSAEDVWISVKGAPEKLLPMCGHMKTVNGSVGVDRLSIAEQVDLLADQGYRVLAIAANTLANAQTPLDTQLRDLTFLGLVGMIDPLRPEAAQAIALCRNAGIEVAMVTGDHPKTSLAIARTLGLARDLSEVVSGPQLKSATTTESKDRLVLGAHVFARVEPQQKLEIVKRLLANDRFVAVTGDGANDAPALKAANVGVAMGKSGSDVAREAADLILTDDRFASIVAGIEEGRIAYSNVRKVIYLLISTGGAEILIFSLSIALETPLPLTAAQILWLNLVTNGIQDVGLAFEPGEGDELNRPPRRPGEPIFDRLMLERVILSALVMGLMTFGFFDSTIRSGASIESARNSTLLLMVLFENVMVGNCRSETHSAFHSNPLRNRVLLVGTLIAQLIHIAALYVPITQKLLDVAPARLTEWVTLLAMSLSVLLVMEIYKFLRPRLGSFACFRKD